MLGDFQRALIEWLGLTILPLVFIEQSQVTKAGLYVGMLVSKHALPNGHSLLQEGFGLGILAL